MLEELEEIREKMREVTATDTRPIDFRNSDGTYRSDFTLMVAKVLAEGVAASVASEVIAIVIEFVTKRKLAAKPSDKTNRRITKVSVRAFPCRVDLNHAHRPVACWLKQKLPRS